MTLIQMMNEGVGLTRISIRLLTVAITLIKAIAFITKMLC